MSGNIFIIEPVMGHIDHVAKEVQAIADAHPQHVFRLLFNETRIVLTAGQDWVQVMRRYQEIRGE